MSELKHFKSPYFYFPSKCRHGARNKDEITQSRHNLSSQKAYTEVGEVEE